MGHGGRPNYISNGPFDQEIGNALGLRKKGHAWFWWLLKYFVQITRQFVIVNNEGPMIALLDDIKYHSLIILGKSSSIHLSHFFNRESATTIRLEVVLFHKIAIFWHIIPNYEFLMHSISLKSPYSSPEIKVRHHLFKKERQTRRIRFARGKKVWQPTWQKNMTLEKIRTVYQRDKWHVEAIRPPTCPPRTSL